MAASESNGVWEAKSAQNQLERVLGSSGFVRSQRLSGFLRFVVERHLEGRDAEIKESLIAIEVFGRPPDYDPKRDPVVRAEASRLRARLGEYYLGPGKDDPMVIELPKGGYIPVIRSTEQTSASVGQRRGKSWLWPGVVLSVLVLPLAVLGWWRLWRQNAPIPIAVLPLINVNQDPANDYFADGLTGEIIRNLSMIEGLEVRSETSSFAFKGKLQRATDVGRQLAADYLIEGSVQRSGQQLRINIQLVRARDDVPMWSGRYDREIADIFAVQDEMSRGIVNSLRLKLGRGRRRYETSTEAYDLYLRARAMEHDRTPSRGSVSLFEQAIAKDPSFAPAYAGLAMAHLILSGQGSRDVPEEVAMMRTTAEKAVQLDPLSAESYVALGAAYAREAQWNQAEKTFQHSLEIQPNRPETQGYFAIDYFLPLGRFPEAISRLRTAEVSDPLFRFMLSEALSAAGRNEEAMAVCNKLAPESLPREHCLPGYLQRQGRGSEVIEKYGSRPDNPSFINSELACAYARGGRLQEAEAAAARSGRADRAQAFACIGDKDRVFEALDKAAMLGPIRLSWILFRVDRERPGLLRGDPRLKDLRTKVGLPE
jgi:TolB-like protein